MPKTKIRKGQSRSTAASSSGTELAKKLPSVIGAASSAVESSVPAESADIVLLIAKIDEWQYIIQKNEKTVGSDCEKYLPYLNNDLWRSFPQTGHEEQQFSIEIGPPGNKRSAEVLAVILGQAGETNACAVLMHVLARLKKVPKLVVSLGMSATVSQDVRLGDLVVADYVFRYAENARFEDQKLEAVLPSAGVKKAAGTVGEGVELEIRLKIRMRTPVAIPSYGCFVLQSYRSSPEGRSWYDTTLIPLLNQCASEVLSVKSMKKIHHILSRQRKAEQVTHFGSILSGPFLLDSPSFKKALSDIFPQALCLDMESGGFATAAKAFPSDRQIKNYLVIRGISDLGEGKKESDAGLAAAAKDELLDAVGTTKNAFRVVCMKRAWCYLRAVLDTSLANKLVPID